MHVHALTPYINEYTHTHVRVHTHTHTYTHARTHTYTHIHTCTHTHTHTLSLSLSLSLSWLNKQAFTSQYRSQTTKCDILTCHFCKRISLLCLLRLHNEVLWTVELKLPLFEFQQPHTLVLSEPRVPLASHFIFPFTSFSTDPFSSSSLFTCMFSKYPFPFFVIKIKETKLPRALNQSILLLNAEGTLNPSRHWTNPLHANKTLLIYPNIYPIHSRLTWHIFNRQRQPAYIMWTKQQIFMRIQPIKSSINEAKTNTFELRTSVEEFGLFICPADPGRRADDLPEICDPVKLRSRSSDTDFLSLCAIIWKESRHHHNSHLTLPLTRSVLLRFYNLLVPQHKKMTIRLNRGLRRAWTQWKKRSSGCGITNM